MYQIISKYDFIDGFKKMVRSENFSYEGLEALYDYLTSCEEEGGSSIEFDVIAICCEFSELEYEEFINYYDVECDDVECDDEGEIIDIEQVIEEHLDDRGVWFKMLSTSVVFQDF